MGVYRAWVAGASTDVLSVFDRALEALQGLGAEVKKMKKINIYIYLYIFIYVFFALHQDLYPGAYFTQNCDD